MPDPNMPAPQQMNGFITPEQIQQMRALSNQLLTGGQNQGPTNVNGTSYFSPFQGAANVMGQMLGNQRMGQANQLPGQMHQQVTNQMNQAGNSDAISRMLLGGGLPQQWGQQSQQPPPQYGMPGVGMPGQPPPGMPPGIQGQVAPTSAPGQSAQTNQLAGAVSGIESGGNYQSIGPVTKNGDRAYGKYQVLGENIPKWTAEALGQPMNPQQFLSNPQAQEAVFQKKFVGEYVPKYGPEGAAKAWFAGERGMNNPNAKDQLGTTVQSYAQQFNRGMQGGQPQAQPQQMAQMQPQGQGGNLAALYADSRVPEAFKSAVMGGQVPGTITDAQGNMYLFKPGMGEPIPLGIKAPGPEVKFGSVQAPVGTLRTMGQPDPGQPRPAQGTSPPNPNAFPTSGKIEDYVDWAARNEAAQKGAEKTSELEAGINVTKPERGRLEQEGTKTLNEDIDTAISLIDKHSLTSPTTGFTGYVMSQKPGSAANQLSTTLGAIRANAVEGELAKRRLSLPQGMGRIAPSEIENIGKQMGLEQTLDPQVLKQNLLRLKNKQVAPLPASGGGGGFIRPAEAGNGQPPTKVIDGKTFLKINGKWHHAD